jgi:hypothetical protein
VPAASTAGLRRAFAAVIEPGRRPHSKALPGEVLRQEVCVDVEQSIDARIAQVPPRRRSPPWVVHLVGIAARRVGADHSISVLATLYELSGLLVVSTMSSPAFQAPGTLLKLIRKSLASWLRDAAFGTDRDGGAPPAVCQQNDTERNLLFGVLAL